MSIKNSIRELQHRADEILYSMSRFWVWYVLALFALLFLSWPISSINGDCDVWYHLNGGRYFFAHREIPAQSFYSFVEPARNFNNYYWLFQVVLYGVFRIAGYLGLVVLKAALFAAILLMVFRLASLFLGELRKTSGAALLVLMVGLALYPRCLHTTRPHLFSYLAIVLAIFVLEKKNWSLVVLPFLYALWANIHGMEFPVAGLILLGYGAEFLADAIQNKGDSKRLSIAALGLVILSGLALLANPYGIGLLKSPAELPLFLDQTINEMRAVGFETLGQFDWFTVQFLPSNTSKLLILVGLGSALAGLVRGKLRVSHLLLSACALPLFLRSSRFSYEVVLLLLPLISLAMCGVCAALQSQRKVNRIVIALIVILPLIVLGHNRKSGRHFPVDYSYLPKGNVEFLNAIDAGRTVCNVDPMHGGYLQWDLDTSYRVLMDLQMSMFTGRDVGEAGQLLASGENLLKAMDTYGLHYVCAPHQEGAFSDSLRKGYFNEWEPVYFDNSCMLYVNADSLPLIADEFSVRSVDALDLAKQFVIEYPESLWVKLDHVFDRVLQFWPENMMARKGLYWLQYSRGDFDGALATSEDLMEISPRSPLGFALKAYVIQKKDNWKESIPLLKHSARLAEGMDFFVLQRLVVAHAKLKHPLRAAHYYRKMKKQIQIYSRDTRYKDLYILGLCASAAGYQKESQEILEWALTKTPVSDIATRKSINDLFASLRAEGLIPAGPAGPDSGVGENK